MKQPETLCSPTPQKPKVSLSIETNKRLAPESIKSFSLALQSVNDVHGCHSLATSVFGVRDRITNNILQKNLQYATGFLVNETRDALDAATTSETANGGLGDALDIVPQDLAMALGTALTEPFASFSTACETKLRIV